MTWTFSSSTKLLLLWYQNLWTSYKLQWVMCSQWQRPVLPWCRAVSESPVGTNILPCLFCARVRSLVCSWWRWHFPVHGMCDSTTDSYATVCLLFAWRVSGGLWLRDGVQDCLMIAVRKKVLYALSAWPPPSPSTKNKLSSLQMCYSRVKIETLAERTWTWLQLDSYRMMWPWQWCS